MSDAQSSQTPQAGIADALTQLSEETRQLVRQEIDAARDEMWDRAKQLAPGIGLMAGAGALGIFAAASAYRSCLRIVEKVLPPTLAAMFATAALGGGAAYLALRGSEKLKEAPSPVPRDSLHEAASDVHEAASRTAAAA
jgi:hypothetical protein